jgi:diguanylate cyclase (GGDEF)-like protein
VIDRWELYQPVVAGFLAAVAAACGAFTIRGGWRAPRPAPFRRLLGASMVIWSVGQVLAGLLQAGGAGRSLSVLEDVVQVAALPVAMAGVLALPRAVGGPHQVLRILLDSGLLSVAISLVTWRLLLASWTEAPARAGPVEVALVLMPEIALVAMTVVSALRDLEPPLIVLAVGMLSFWFGDLTALHGSITALAPSSLVGQVSYAVAWPLAAWGAVRYDPGGRPADGPAPIEVDPDARVTVITTIAALLLLLGGVGEMSWHAWQDGGDLPVDPVSWVALLSAIGMLGVRELLNARLRVTLLNRLHEEATVDPLTGLANRRLLVSRLADVRPEDSWCLVLLDLDGFKGVNDLLGQAVGDRLLAAVGQRLVRSLPRTALVARTEGDEFAVLIPGTTAVGGAVAEVVLTAVRRSGWDVEGVTRLPVTASVGVTKVGEVYPTSLEDGSGAGRLSDLTAAGAALHLAKAAGGDRAEVFDTRVALARSRRLMLEERLRAAIREDVIDVRFQPVVDLRTGAIAGVEALARWTDPQFGSIAPQEFIPIAEQTGLVVALGELVLHRALEEAVEHGLPSCGLRVACNVSPVQLCVPGFPQLVEDALTRSAVPPHLLVVEVTEAVLVEEEGPAVAALRRLVDIGVIIAIDDFGTGYSALGYLRRLPAQMLKIDRSLTAALVDEAEAKAITQAVIELGANLAVSIVVEGIETSDVAELVLSMGAGLGQGTLYGAALPMSEIVRLVRRPPAGMRLA